MNTPRAHVLVVEDESLMLKVTEDLLSSFGFAITGVRGGEEALAVLERTKVDVILSDVHMPGLDGFALLREVRRRPAWQDIPFIIVSGMTDRADMRMGMALGADDYVTKPYSPEDVLRTVAVRLERARRLAEIRVQKNEFITQTLPHELRTPLTGIIGYAELMLQLAQDGKSLSPEELADFGRAFHTSGLRLHSIVDNYLFWSRLEAARDPSAAEAASPYIEEVNREGLAQLATKVARHYNRSQDLTVECPEPLRFAVIMPGVHFVARHLIENALKHSLPGQPVHVRARPEGAALGLTVTDQGRGMSPEQIAQIGPGRQFDRDKFEQQGLGMGLAITQTFAQLSGGSLQLERRPGGGMVAALRLPRG